MIILLIVIAVLILIFIAMYNRLVVGRNRVRNAWFQIDVQLKRRYDLIPNLVETVKGYAAHERGVFEKVAELRNRAMSAKTVSEAADANNQLTATLKTLFAVAEAYPNLKANENFMRLQEELTTTENKISFARQFYNDVTMSYNILVQQFPTNLFAALFGYKPEDFWHTSEEEKAAVKVKF